MPDYSLLNDPDMKEIFDSFLVETKEILEKLDLDLVKLESQPDDKELLNEIFRSFHTIKGTSGFLGLVKLQSFTHKLEDILNKLRKGEMLLNDKLMTGILKGFDSITELVDFIELNKNEDYNIEEATDFLQSLLDDYNKDEKIEQEEEIKPEVEISDKIIENENLNEEASKNEESKVSRVEESIKRSSAKVVEQTIRVEVERLDDLLNLISELVLGRNRLLQINEEASHLYEGTKLAHDLTDTTRQIDLMTTELQLAVMKTRMIKIGKVFNKFPRLIRDLSKETGKEVQLIIKGEDTELDKTLIEEINDPLVHLVRNSIDHGIETPKERIAKGKPSKGTVVLSAEHEGNDIIISIEDDGGGIDTKKILNIAIKKGIISKEKSNDLSKQEIFNLIFAPGFSTAEKVTNISGRGVGMDVVKTNVTKLHGIINIDSELNKGTKVVIKLPLTLAIIQGLLVEVAGETIVIPLSSVVEVIRVTEKDIYYVNGTECIKLRDRVVPLCDIDSALYHIDSKINKSAYQQVVIVGIAEKRVGIKVDNLIGQKEIVIKSLGKYLGNIEGIAGSTIMGDGKVIMIVDVAELVNKILELN